MTKLELLLTLSATLVLSACDGGRAGDLQGRSEPVADVSDAAAADTELRLENLPLLGAVHGRGTREIFCEGRDGNSPQADSAVLPQDARELIQPGISDGRAVHFNGWWENCTGKLPESEHDPKTCGAFRAQRDEGKMLINTAITTGAATSAEKFNDGWRKWGGGLTERPEEFDAMYTLRYGSNSPHYRNPYPILKPDGTMEDPNAAGMDGGSGQLPIGMYQEKDEDGKWTSNIMGTEGGCAICHAGQVGLPGESPDAGAWWGIPNANTDILMVIKEVYGNVGAIIPGVPLAVGLPVPVGLLLGGPRGLSDVSTTFELAAFMAYDWQSLDVLDGLTGNYLGLHARSWQDSPSWFHQGHHARKFKAGELSVNAHRMTSAAAQGGAAKDGATRRAYIDRYSKSIATYHESLRAPDWPEEFDPIDTQLAEQGAILFHAKNLWAEPGNADRAKPKGNGSCAGCHGAYSPRYVNDPAYLATPELEGMASYIVPMNIIGSEEARYETTSSDEFTASYNSSWWSYPEGQPGYVDPAEKSPLMELLDNNALVPQPKGACELGSLGEETRYGYLAPALHGVWTTAPYLHNGSVPTVAQLLDSSKRHTMWQRKLQTIGPVTGFDQSFATGYDFENMGWKHDEVLCESYALDPFMSCNPIDPEEGSSLGLLLQNILQGEAMLAGVLHVQYTDNPERRFIFDTRNSSQGNQGHEFSDVLTDRERKAVIEYLKTL